jgi:hypothetical protein
VYAFTQNRKNWQTDEGPNRYRRTMYTMFYRSAPHPSLTTFDSPDFQSVCTRRVRSNTPLQALAMGNDPAMFELAKAFADRILTDGALGDEAARVAQAYLIAFARHPTAEEAKLVRRFLAERRVDFANDPPAARQIAGQVAHGGDAGVAERAAWTVLTRALMNTDEFITRE